MAKEVNLTREEAEDFYSEHKGKDFFEALVQNMCRYCYYCPLSEDVSRRFERIDNCPKQNYLHEP